MIWKSLAQRFILNYILLGDDIVTHCDPFETTKRFFRVNNVTKSSNLLCVERKTSLWYW